MSGWLCRDIAGFLRPVTPSETAAALAAEYPDYSHSSSNSNSSDGSGSTGQSGSSSTGSAAVQKKRKRASAKPSASHAEKWTPEELDLLTELQSELVSSSTQPKQKWKWLESAWTARVQTITARRHCYHPRTAAQLKSRAQSNGRIGGAAKKRKTDSGSVNTADDSDLEAVSDGDDA